MPDRSANPGRGPKRLLRAARAAGPFLLVLAVALSAYQAGALQPLKTTLYDLRFRLTPRPATGQVALVEIDSKSIAAIGTWPWPRRIHAGLIDGLKDLGASEIAFDVDFSSASTPEDDAALEAALRRAGGSVILAAFSQSFSHDSGSQRIAFNRPIERFAQNAWPATVNVRPDRDGRIRRLAYGSLIGGEPTPSIPAVFANHQGEIGRDFLVDFGIQASGIDRVSAIDVLRGSVDPRRLQGKKVLIGASAIELRDFFQVPVLGVISGPLLQALGAEALTQGRALEETSRALAIAGMLFILCGAALASIRARWSVLLAGLGVLSLSIEGAAVLLQLARPVLLDTSAWQATLAALCVSLTFREIDFRRILLAVSKNEARDAKTILDQIVADNFAGVVVATEDRVIRAASRSASRILNPAAPADLIGQRLEDALPPALGAAVREAVQAFKDGTWDPRQPADLEYATTEGEVRILEYVVTPSRLSGDATARGRSRQDRVAACLTFADITEERQAQARTAYMARFDMLTGLANRNQFLERLGQAVGRRRTTGEASTVLYFDLDRFKNVNDSLGRGYGDLLLREAADRARAVAGEADLVARLTGAEFAILQPTESREEAAGLAARLIARLGEAYLLDGHRALVGVSVGIARIEAEDDGPTSIMKNTDTAHSRAKAAGGNAYRFFDAALDLGLRARQALEIELSDAFERGEFEAYYQPQIDMPSGEIVGVEALLRWRHPERGFVSPAEFIPVAEDTGLIEPLGAWILRRACEDAMIWPRPIKVAVNLSPVQFARGDLVATVRDTLAATGLPPGRLDLEITESLFIQDHAAIQTIADAFRRMGISFSLDDFGTGYSSLNYLRKFKVQKLKLDQSFIAGLPSDKESVAIVEAVCALAQSLGIRINAEGIETSEQADFLRRLGCHEGQGYLFGKPQPSTSIAGLLLAPIPGTAAGERKMVA